MESKQLVLCVKDFMNSEAQAVECVISEVPVVLPPLVEISVPLPKDLTSSIKITFNDQASSCSLSDLLEGQISFEQWIFFEDSSQLLLSGAIHSSRPPALSLRTSEYKCKYLNGVASVQNLIKGTEEAMDALKKQMGPMFDKLLQESIKLRSSVKSPERTSRSLKRLDTSRSRGKSSEFSRLNSSSSLASLGDCYVDFPSRHFVKLDDVASLDRPILVLMAIGANLKHLQSKHTDELDKELETIQKACDESLQDCSTRKEDKDFQFQEHRCEVDNFKGGLEIDNDDVDSRIKQDLELKESLEIELESKEPKTISENPESLLKELIELEGEVQSIHCERAKVQHDFLEEIAQFKDHFEALSAESYKTLDEQLVLKDELSKENTQLDFLSDEVRSLKSKVLIKESELSLHKEEQFKHTFKSDELSRTSSSIQKLSAELFTYAQQKEENKNRSSELLELLELDCKGLESLIAQAQTTSKTHKEYISGLMEELKENNGMAVDLQGTMKTFSNADTLFNRRCKLLKAPTLKTIMEELDFLADSTLQWASASIAGCRVFQQFSDIYEQREHECEVLEEAAYELKKENPIYTPKLNDPIDCALGEYLNQSDDALQVAFQRLEKGLYMFGTKKVLVKFERQRLQVKVGGGFLPIDKFLSEYEILEKEKIENKCYEFSPEAKKIMGKWAETVIDARETSPVRMRESLEGAKNSHRKTAIFAVREKSSLKRSLSSMTAADLKKIKLK